MLGAILIIVLAVLLLGTFVGRGHPLGAPLGYWPSGGIGLILVVILVLVLLGRL